MSAHPSGPRAVRRGVGLNRSEGLLNKLSERTFIDLWSYPNVFRDQRFAAEGRGDGKELCDLLVAFGNHVIIFSDKHIEYKPNVDPSVAWRRWYSKAVKASANQLFGAERWIRQHPDRLYLDSACIQPFPVPLPKPEEMRIHRVVVAHGAGEACSKYFGEGSSGSLMIAPDIVGDAHLGLHGTPPSNSELRPALPFMLGQVDLERGYVHVLDDVTLNIVLEMLDTVTDFIDYLEQKEQFIVSGGLLIAPGEEELLAYYLQNIDSENKHYFPALGDHQRLSISEGLWNDYQRSTQRQAQIFANQVSYGWDDMTRRFSFHSLNDSQYYSQNITDSETLIRFLARESRLRRRYLSDVFVQLLKAIGVEDYYKAAVIQPVEADDPHYVFLVFRHVDGVPYDHYRRDRHKILQVYLHVIKIKFPEAQDIVGIAIGPTDNDGSEDLMYLDAREWSKELQEYGEMLGREHGMLERTSQMQRTMEVYPSEIAMPPESMEKQLDSAKTVDTRGSANSAHSLRRK